MTRRSKISAGGRLAARILRRGITLVEITMVAMILALSIIAVVTVLGFSWRDTEELKNQARVLAGFLEHVRTRAAITGQRHTVQYDLNPPADEKIKYFVWVPRAAEDGEDDIVEDDSDDARKAIGFHDMPTRPTSDGGATYLVWIDRIGFGDGTTVNDDTVRVDFMPTGGSHWHYVYLRNRLDEYYTIVVNPLTGFGEVYPGEYKPEPPERLK